MGADHGRSPLPVPMDRDGLSPRERLKMFGTRRKSARKNRRPLRRERSVAVWARERAQNGSTTSPGGERSARSLGPGEGSRPRPRTLELSKSCFHPGRDDSKKIQVDARGSPGHERRDFNQFLAARETGECCLRHATPRAGLTSVRSTPSSRANRRARGLTAKTTG